jgi:hypothetical protein
MCPVMHVDTRSAAFWQPLSEALTPRSRSQRVAILLFAIILMGLADLSMTLTFITSVGMVEANPVARLVMQLNHPGYVILWKLATMLVGIGVLYWARRTKGAEVGTWVSFIAMAALSIHWLTFAGQVSTMDADYAVMAAVDDPRWISITP